MVVGDQVSLGMVYLAVKQAQRVKLFSESRVVRVNEVKQAFRGDRVAGEVKGSQVFKLRIFG